MIKQFNLLGVIFFALLLCSCGQNQGVRQDGNHFSFLPSSETGITFNNKIVETDSLNLIANQYAYMGGGVAVADINNDGLQDLLFSGNNQPCKLYLNKGNFIFEDISQNSGINTAGYWATGVAVIDVNNDGFSDFYICMSGSPNPGSRKNKLFINNQHSGFTEDAESYGLADSGYSTQAAFFDYDGDGDLDMFLVHHILYKDNLNNITTQTFSGITESSDKLYRNEGIPKGGTHPIFSDVSLQAGIKEDACGLGLVVSDFNDDGWPDVYVTNDFIGNDALWMNNKNGTFTNAIAASTGHQSYSSMGVDAADINNDGLTDLVTLDMQPSGNERQKMMFNFLSYERFELERRAGYQPEYMRNMLQLNRGFIKIKDTVQPIFSEIGQLSGIHQTDWSWSVLLADFDNDGRKDIHITNGFGRDLINSDFIFFVNSKIMPGMDINARNKMMNDLLAQYGTIRLNNYFFSNKGTLIFEDQSEKAGISKSSLSNGCAYADLDNDGDLDLIVNNINDEAFIMRNDLRHLASDTINNFINIQLVGDSSNKIGYGTKITVYTGNTIQSVEQNPVRGYLSSVDTRLFAGLGNARTVDSVAILWPNKTKQLLKNVKANQFISVYQKQAVASGEIIPPNTITYFKNADGNAGIGFKHNEKFFYDFKNQRLLPQKYSQLGPFISTGDFNKDGLTDIYVGGASGQSGVVGLQLPDGTFKEHKLSDTNTKTAEDLGSFVFDADGDGDEDIIISGGSNEFQPGSVEYLPRLYLNDGKGDFTLSRNAIPASVCTSAQAITGVDYDADGDIDLFIGGRIIPGSYPLTPKSYLLQNNGGKFTDVTEKVCSRLSAAGMITSAVWADINGDKLPDLILAGEWMPIRFFINERSKFEEWTLATHLQNMNGFWRSLDAADIDHDGDIDIVAGNIGLNNKFRITKEEPAKMVAMDIDGNGSIDPLWGYYIASVDNTKKLFPAAGHDQLMEQVPSLKKRFLLYKDYSTATLNDIVEGTGTENSMMLQCEETRSGWLENDGKGHFTFHAFPIEAQFAPVNAFVCEDVNKDGIMDIILAGNEYQAEVATGRYDASFGLYLEGSPQKTFKPYSLQKSGLYINGDVKDLKVVNTANKKRLLIAAVNNGLVKVLEIN